MSDKKWKSEADIPLLKAIGQKMLVWDDDESKAVEGIVVGRVLNSPYPITTISGTPFKHAKPLLEPHEIAPEGYRLVTKEEMEKYPKPNKYACCLSDKWEFVNSDSGQDYWYTCYTYAVPKCYVFEEEVLEMTMEDLEKAYGKKVKIIVKEEK